MILGKNPSASRLAILGMVAAPFYLNDFANIFVKDFRVWLLIDYVFVKALPLGFLTYLVGTKRLTGAELGLRIPGASQLVGFTLLATILGIGLDQIGWPFFKSILPNTHLGDMPAITNPTVATIDLYFGILFVAITEEVVFRGLAFTALREQFASVKKVFIYSSLLFGLIHWSLGLHAIINTAIIGFVFMVVVWKTGSIIPTIIAHFLVDFVSFSSLGGYVQQWLGFRS